MKTLVLPDLHHRVKAAQSAMALHPDADHVVFLGDFFDDFDDSPREAAQTALWLKERIENYPKDVFLFGNHDLPYAHPEGAGVFDCPGWTPAKHARVKEILGPEHWRRFQLAHAEGGFLFSHAGVTPWLFGERTPEAILERCRADLDQFFRARTPTEVPLSLSAVGRARGGRCERGGIVWQC